MILKACPRCGAMTPFGKTYCIACQAVVDKEQEERKQRWRQESNRRYNKKRDPKYGAFYSSKAWKVLSAKRIQADGYKCCKCGDWATEVDHIIPVQTEEGWNCRFDWNNLQSLCTKCHNEKHRRFLTREQKSKVTNRMVGK